MTIENQRDHVLCRQPATVKERTALATEFKKRLNAEVPIYIDDMDNAVWKELGGGPNMGVLVGNDGKVKTRQGWFDASSMGHAIDAFLTVVERGNRTAAELRVEEGFPDWQFGKAATDGNLAALKEQLAQDPRALRDRSVFSPR